MTTKPDSPPAFPVITRSLKNDDWSTIQHVVCPGVSLRVHAAIHLRVPDSGIDWLDEMIEKSRADWFAGQALAGAASGGGSNTVEQIETRVFNARMYSETMIAEKGKR